MKLVKARVSEPARLYIEDFNDDLNYTGVILYIGNVNHERLRTKLEKDYVNKLWRLDNALVYADPSMKNFIYIENCDLQDLDFPLHTYMEEGYDVYILYEDEQGEFYIKRKLY